MPRLHWYVDMLLHDQHDPATFIRSLAHTSKVQLPARFISTCLRRALQSVITGEPFGNMPLGEVLDRTLRRVARSISFGNCLASKGSLWTLRPVTFMTPSGRRPTASYTLPNGACEPSTPPKDPTTLSLCPKSHQIVAAPYKHRAT